MIKLKVNKAHVQCKVKGDRVNLLTELTLGTAQILKSILSDSPDNSFKELLLKSFFENVLFSLKAIEGESNE